jgi:hypothetical protein
MVRDGWGRGAVRQTNPIRAVSGLETRVARKTKPIWLLSGPARAGVRGGGRHPGSEGVRCGQDGYAVRQTKPICGVFGLETRVVRKTNPISGSGRPPLGFRLTPSLRPGPAPASWGRARGPAGRTLQAPYFRSSGAIAGPQGCGAERATSGPTWSWLCRSRRYLDPGRSGQWEIGAGRADWGRGAPGEIADEAARPNAH